MRLIDAEPIEKAIDEWLARETKDPVTQTIVDNVGTWVTHAPTIDAIPIEWLMQWKQERTVGYEFYTRAIVKYAIACAIDDWREENE